MDPLMRRTRGHLYTRGARAGFDLDAAQEACRAMEGRHDFTHLSSAPCDSRERDPVRTALECCCEGEQRHSEPWARKAWFHAGQQGARPFHLAQDAFVGPSHPLHAAFARAAWRGRAGFLTPVGAGLVLWCGADISWMGYGPGVRFRIRSTGFLYKQVRHMVGASVAVAQGRCSVEDLRERLAAGASVPRGQLKCLWTVAEPRGLSLR